MKNLTDIKNLAEALAELSASYQEETPENKKIQSFAQSAQNFHTAIRENRPSNEVAIAALHYLTDLHVLQTARIKSHTIDIIAGAISTIPFFGRGLMDAKKLAAEISTSKAPGHVYSEETDPYLQTR